MSRSFEKRTLIIADTSVLLNFAAIDRLDLFAAAGFEAHVPNNIVAEVKRQESRQSLERAIAQHRLSELALTDIAEIAAYAKLSKRFGDGESATKAVEPPPPHPYPRSPISPML